MTVRGEPPDTVDVGNVVVGVGARRQTAFVEWLVVSFVAAACAAGCGSGTADATGGHGGGAGVGVGGNAGRPGSGGSPLGGAGGNGTAGGSGIGGSITGSGGSGGRAGAGGSNGGGPGGSGGAGGASGGMAGGGATGGAGGAGGAATGGGGGIRPGCGSPDIDVPAVGVTATMTFNGVSIPTQQAGWGSVFAHNAAGDTAALGQSFGAPQTKMIIPGTYDLYYTVGASVDATVPINTSAILRSGVVFPTTGTTPLAVDVPVLTLSGAVTFGGGMWPDSTDSGIVELFDGVYLWTSLTNSAGATYTLGVVPGVYDLIYQWDGAWPLPPGLPRAPFNGGTTLRSAVSIQGAPGSAATLNVDVPATLISGNITVNGAAVASPAPLMFWDSSTKGLGRADLSDQLSVTSYTSSIIPGTYDLYTDGYGSTPVNSRGLVRAGMVITPSTTALDLDIPAGTVAGTVTVGGVVAGTTSDSGLIVLVDIPDDAARIAGSNRGAYSASVLPGTYDVYYQGPSPGVTFTTISPRNENAKIASGVIVKAGATTTLNIDVPVATVKGSVTVNGTKLGGGSYGDVFLVGPNGDKADIARTSQSKGYSAPVVPGTYDLYYQSTSQLSLSGASSVPRNSWAKLRSGVVIGPGTNVVDVDIPAVTVTGALTVGGAAVSNQQEEGDVWLQTDAGDYISLGTTSATSYAVTLVPGQYDVYYKLESGGAVVPNNNYAKIRCFDVGQ